MIADAEEIASYVGRDSGHPGRRLSSGDERHDELAGVVRDLVLHAARYGSCEHGGGREKFRFRHDACGIPEDIRLKFWLGFWQGGLDEFDLEWVKF